MGELAVSGRVVSRNGIGQFIRECEQAAEATASETVERGAELSRAMAPIGHKHDMRTIPLNQSIHSRMISRTSGEWYATARHALPQETGSRGHPIYGHPGLKFYWEKAGRMFLPASEYYHRPNMITVVNHPGNPAHPYLRPAYEIVMREAMAIARKHYPK